MTTTLQDVLPAIDDARQAIADAGFRLYRVLARTRTWTGATQGIGSFSDVDTELLPRPRVRAQMSDGPAMPIDDVYSRAGEHFEGTLIVDKISPQIPLATLFATLAENQRQYFLIQGADGGEIASQLFIPDGPPFRQTTGWVVTLLKVEG